MRQKWVTKGQVYCINDTIINAVRLDLLVTIILFTDKI